MITIEKNGQTLIVTNGAYESTYKKLGFKPVSKIVEDVVDLSFESKEDKPQEKKSTKKKSTKKKKNSK